MPADGYTAMFERLLAASPGVELHLGMNYREAIKRWNYKHLVYTGPIDEYFDYRFGALPYRSLRFEHESFTAEQLIAREPISGKPGFWQPNVQVNYPSHEVPYTRVVEVKHVTGQITDHTTIVREFPQDWSPGDEPFYPIPAPDSRLIYSQYAELATKEERTSFIGRLATYRYYNMDQIAGMALTEAQKLIAKYSQTPQTPIGS